MSYQFSFVGTNQLMSIIQSALLFDYLENQHEKRNYVQRHAINGRIFSEKFSFPTWKDMKLSSNSIVSVGNELRCSHIHPEFMTNIQDGHEGVPKFDLWPGSTCSSNQLTSQGSTSPKKFSAKYDFVGHPLPLRSSDVI